MKAVRKRRKCSKKAFRIVFYIISLFYIVTLILFTKSLLSLKGIETLIRVVLIIFFILYAFIYIFVNFINIIKKKYKFLIISSLISILFILVFMYGSYYINVIYKNISGLQENKELYYTTYLISLKDKEFDNKSKIGSIIEDNDSNAYKLAKKLYSEKKLANKIVDYNDYFKMLGDLYSKKIDAVFVPGNYITLFGSDEEFSKIADETVIIYEYTEKMANKDLDIISDKTFDEPLTFLLLGVDSEKNGLNAQAAFNGDTLMVVTFNPKTLSVVMTSIPRDTYVPIACRNNTYAKINSAAAYGTSCVVSTVNQFLDINIDYYAKINFKGVVSLVDALGGVEVDVEKPTFKSWGGVNYNGRMCEQNSDRQFGDKLVCVNPGLQVLSGEEALAYSRNRHLYIGGDLDRIRHQQQVVEAIAKKVISFSSIKDFESILNAISSNIATNMEADTILSGYQVVKNMVGNILSGEDPIHITKAYLETYDLWVYVPSQGRKTSAQGYYKKSLESIQKAIKVSLGKENEEVVKTFNYSANDPYSASVPGKGLKDGISGSLLPNFVGKNVSEAEKYCNNNGINISISKVDPGDEHYNGNIEVGLIGAQSVHEDVLLSTVKEITFYVVNSKKAVGNNDNSDIDTEKDNDNSNDDKIINDLIN